MGALRPSLHKRKEFICLENDTQTYNKNNTFIITPWARCRNHCKTQGIHTRTKKMLAKPTERKMNE